MLAQLVALGGNTSLLFTKVILKLYCNCQYDHQPDTVMVFPFYAGELRHGVGILESIFGHYWCSHLGPKMLLALRSLFFFQSLEQEFECLACQAAFLHL